MILTGEARRERELIVVFVDLSLFAKEAERRVEVDIASTIDGYYERVADHVARGQGAVVKFIGDGALLVFDPSGADAALRALLDMRLDVDAWLAGAGWASRISIKAHSGAVIAGGFGARGAKSFDIIGNVVNIAARLPRPFHVSPQVFRLLSPESRKELKKHTPPITYIPLGDGHV
jgi:adenylate cyclase